MKLRIRGNSLRLRLTKSDVAAFLELGRLDNSIPLGAAPAERLGYTLLADPCAKSLTVKSERGVITVTVPASAGVAWAKSEEVGLYEEQVWPNGETTRLSVEKDFQCLDKRHGEIIADAYPHPAKPR